MTKIVISVVNCFFELTIDLLMITPFELFLVKHTIITVSAVQT